MFRGGFSRAFGIVAGLMAGAVAATAQTTFVVDNFSPSYYGEVVIEDTAEVFSKGSVAIFERGSHTPLFRVASEELALNLHDGKVLANIHDLPYGEQSLIVFEDFNFDGKKDFAIQDGQNSCYHGPSFQIYLATITGFVHSDAFTQLAQDYCGLFDADPNFKTLHTMTKDGCCWHQFSEFVVENNVPKAVHIIEEDARSFPFVSVSESSWNGSKMVATNSRTFDPNQEEVKVLFSFTVEKNGKVAYVFESGEMLQYVLSGADNGVEFAFPADAAAAEPRFWYNRKANTLEFENNGAAYTITDAAGKAAIQVRYKGKTSFLHGIASSRQGSLTALAGGQWANLSTR